LRFKYVEQWKDSFEISVLQLFRRDEILCKRFTFKSYRLYNTYILKDFMKTNGSLFDRSLEPIIFFFNKWYSCVDMLSSIGIHWNLLHSDLTQVILQRDLIRHFLKIFLHLNIHMSSSNVFHLVLWTLSGLSSFISVFEHSNWMSLRKVMYGNSTWLSIFSRLFTTQTNIFLVVIEVSYLSDLRTLSKSSSLIWAFDHSNWLNLRKLMCGHLISPVIEGNKILHQDE